MTENTKREVETIRVDDLHQYLIDNKDKIGFVCLIWNWINNTAMIDLDSYGLDRKGDRISLYAAFSYTDTDDEYSYVGNVEGAIEYAENYNQWDGREINLDGGVLFATVEENNLDADDYPGGAEDLENSSAIDIEYLGLEYYHNCKRYRYDGPVFRDAGGDEE